MRVNRERLIAILAALVLLAGIWSASAAFLRPRPDIQVPDVTLRETRPAIPRPHFGRYESETVPTRNPFRFTEGWTRLDALPLAPPPVTDRARLVPLLRIAPGDGSDEPSFAFVEPPRVDESDAKKDEKKSGKGEADR